jgi:hypothetical protein
MDCLKGIFGKNEAGPQPVALDSGYLPVPLGLEQFAHIASRAKSADLPDYSAPDDPSPG